MGSLAKLFCSTVCWETSFILQLILNTSEVIALLCIYIHIYLPCGWDSKESACIQETQTWFPGQEHPLEKGVITHSSSLAWEIP